MRGGDRKVPGVRCTDVAQQQQQGGFSHGVRAEMRDHQRRQLEFRLEKEGKKVKYVLEMVANIMTTKDT